MDQTPLSEVDVEQGVDVTLRMFSISSSTGFKWSGNSMGTCESSANGSELNQIWTNLIDNAISAMATVRVDTRFLRCVRYSNQNSCSLRLWTTAWSAS